VNKARTFFPTRLFLPPQFIQGLAVDGVPQVIERAVLHKGNETLLPRGLAHQADQVLSNLNVGLLMRPTNVVNLARHPTVEDHIKGTCHILDVEEVAGVQPVPVQSQGPVAHQ
jgi:hypothetical protein